MMSDRRRRGNAIPPTSNAAYSSRNPHPSAVSMPTVVRVHSQERQSALAPANQSPGTSTDLQQKRRNNKRTRTLAHQDTKSDWRRLVYISFCTAVLVFALISVIGVKWTVSKHDNPRRVDTVDRPGARMKTEIGLFEICNCTGHATDNGAAVSCPGIASYTTGAQATSILGLLCQGAGFFLFLATTYITLNKRIELAMVILWVGGMAFSIISWSLMATLYTKGPGSGMCDIPPPTPVTTPPISIPPASMAPNSTATPAIIFGVPAPPVTYVAPSSYNDQGLNFSWAFGFRIIESLICLVIGILLGLRWRGHLAKTGSNIIGLWPLVLTLQLLVLIMSATSTSSNDWIAGGDNDFPDQDSRVVGPWNDCRCYNLPSKCTALAPQFRAAGAFAIMTIICLCVQVGFACTVPALLPQIPEIAVVVFAWITWLLMCISWSIAVAALTGCRCSGEEQAFNWPFPIAFLSFLAQTWIAVFVSYQYGKKRLLVWASELHRRADDGEEDLVASLNTASMEGTATSPRRSSKNGGQDGDASAVEETVVEIPPQSMSSPHWAAAVTASSGEEGDKNKDGTNSTTAANGLEEQQQAVEVKPKGPPLAPDNTERKSRFTRRASSKSLKTPDKRRSRPRPSNDSALPSAKESHSSDGLTPTPSAAGQEPADQLSEISSVAPSLAQSVPSEVDGVDLNDYDSGFESVSEVADDDYWIHSRAPYA